ncbi:MAG: hypothetical protein V4543_01135 [Bacteroidota bacterium]
MAFDVNSALVQLRADATELSAQLDKIRTTIAALENLSPQSSSKSSKISIAPAASGKLRGRKPGTAGSAKAAAEAENAIAATTKTGKKGKAGKKDDFKPLPVPAEYHAGLKKTAKMAFVLNGAGELSAKDIAKRIVELEPGADEAKTAKDFGFLASRLFRSKNINARRTGKSYVYSA